jgi:P27 family predicted phage terminase small subunit
MKKLSVEARKLKESLIEEYSIVDKACLLLLNTAMEAYDEFQKAKAVVDKDGLTVRGDRGGIKSHPLLATIRDCRSQFLTAIKMLNLDIIPSNDGPGRPSGQVR